MNKKNKIALLSLVAIAAITTTVALSQAGSSLLSAENNDTTRYAYYNGADSEHTTYSTKDNITTFTTTDASYSAGIDRLKVQNAANVMINNFLFVPSGLTDTVLTFLPNKKLGIIKFEVVSVEITSIQGSDISVFANYSKDTTEFFPVLDEDKIVTFESSGATIEGKTTTIIISDLFGTDVAKDVFGIRLTFNKNTVMAVNNFKITYRNCAKTQ